MLTKPPQRIVSLVPSQTELLHALNLEERVVGITKFCIHPASWFHTKTRVGGTKEVNIEAVRSLQPDLILANKEENVLEQISALEAIAPVWVSDVTHYENALEMIQTVGQLTHTLPLADELIRNIQNQFNDLRKYCAVNPHLPIRVAYLIWRNPYMTIGGDTFIHNMLEQCGLENIFGNHTRYPTVHTSDLIAMQPDVVLLSTEPYPFQQKHIEELRKELPDTHMLLADGEMFSWYGSRMLHAPAYFIQLMKDIHMLTN